MAIVRENIQTEQSTLVQSQAGELIIGLMSGTSVDGIDASLVSFRSMSDLTVVENEFTPYSDNLRAQINQAALNSSEIYRCEDLELHATLASHYAEASLNLIKKAQVPLEDISAIANHGQTIRHEPNLATPFSLQLGDAQLIAQHTGIRTISQFRQADLSAGGQGAPLMPAFHKAVLGKHQSLTKGPAFVLNIGGIGNITQLNSPVLGFDTGPGNTLLDQWIEKHQNKAFDKNGEWARSGRVISNILEKLLTDPYLQKGYPKSTGTDYFNLPWLARRVARLEKFRPQDIQATLTAFSAKSIALGLSQIAATAGQLYVCGGGVHNKMLMELLNHELTDFSIKPTDELGIPSDWVEAVGFAWLGYCHLHGVESNLPSVTGANKKVILGHAFQPQ